MSDTSNFTDIMRAAYAHCDEELRSKFDRSLPMQDALFDRWERANSLGFGEGSSIYNSVYVFGSVRVGTGTWVGPGVMLDGSGSGIVIGSTCTISASVAVYTHDTIAWALSGGKEESRRGSVAIGDCCHIGSQSIISAGVTIGNQCVVLANSLVSADISDHTVVGGSPARRIGKVIFANGKPELHFDSGGISRVTEPLEPRSIQGKLKSR